MSDLPDPLTPADCDLRGLEYMPLLGLHLFGSEFNARADDSEWRAGVTLWWASWNQVPAASLPDDDVALCRFADLGRDVKSWKKLRDNALHGWVKCADGRIYHPFLAKQALVAWDKRQAERTERTSSAERKARERAERSRMFEQLSGVGVTPEWNTKTSDLRDLVTEHVTNQSRVTDYAVTQPVTGNVTAKTGRDGTGRKEEENPFPDGNGDGLKKPDAEPPGELPLPDPDKQFWDEAKAFLGTKAASKIGQWVRDHGMPAVSAALVVTKAENDGRGADNPIAFMQVVLRNGAEREAKRIEDERKAEAEFDRRHPRRVLSRSDARALMTDAEFARWEARQGGSAAA